jgi:hypothetical protein
MGLFQSPSQFSRQYRVFISHAWDYGDEYDGVVNLLNSNISFRWTNLSITIDQPLPMLTFFPKSYRNIVRQLDEEIQRADCVLVLAAMYFAHRGWIQSEIEAAAEYNKPIIAVLPRGQERVPEALSRVAVTAPIGWNSNSIISAIRQYSAPVATTVAAAVGIPATYAGPAPLSESTLKSFASMTGIAPLPSDAIPTGAPLSGPTLKSFASMASIAPLPSDAIPTRAAPLSEPTLRSFASMASIAPPPSGAIPTGGLNGASDSQKNPLMASIEPLPSGIIPTGAAPLSEPTLKSFASMTGIAPLPSDAIPTGGLYGTPDSRKRPSTPADFISLFELPKE